MPIIILITTCLSWVIITLEKRKQLADKKEKNLYNFINLNISLKTFLNYHIVLK